MDTYRGLGTALIAALLTGHRIYTAHVGDVRCYLKQPSGFRAISRDHSLVSQWVAEGRMTAEQARLSPQRSQLLQAVGASQRIKPEIHTERFEPGDWLLLCSDGLWSAVPDAAIDAAISGPGSVRKKANTLAADVRNAGRKDDISLILYRHDPVAYSF